MEQTLQALSGILLKAIPTIIILVLLHQFFKMVLFGPLEKMLKERHELTGGARHAAERALKNAEKKTLEYEAKLQDAKSVVYKEQEETRKTWLSDQVAQLERAKNGASAQVTAARAELARDVVAAKAALQDETAGLAEQIATTLASGRKA
jgi:F-type H+-transporting ATPase subunit b